MMRILFVIGELTANLENGFDSMKTTLNYQQWLDRWDTVLNDPEILDHITTQTSLDKPTLPVINAIKSWIKAKLDTD